MAVREERLAQQKLYEAEAEVDARYWNREILKSRSLRNLNLNDFSFSKQIDGQIRLKEIKSVCVENWN